MSGQILHHPQTAVQSIDNSGPPPPGNRMRIQSLLSPPSPDPPQSGRTCVEIAIMFVTLAGFSCFVVLALQLTMESPSMFREASSTVDRPGDGVFDPLRAGSRNLVQLGSLPSAASKINRSRINGSGRINYKTFSDSSDGGPLRSSPRGVQWNGTVCWTEACISEGAAIRSAVEVNLDPCTDFYSYACKRWSHDRPLPRGHAVVSFDLDLLDVFTLDAFNALTKPSRDPLNEKLRSLLLACVLTPDDSFKPLAVSALHSVGLANWPYDHDADADVVSISTTLGRMVRLYGFDPLFGLTEVIDPTSSTRSKTAYAFKGPIPIITEGSVPSHVYKFVSRAYEIIVENIQERSLYDPLETELQLVAVAASIEPAAVTALKLSNCTKTSLNELPSVGEWLFWDKLFLEVYGETKLETNHSEILLPEPSLFEKLNDTSLLNARSSKFKMANYLGFRLLLLLSPFGTAVDDANVPASLGYATHPGYPTSLHEYQACLRFLDKIEPVVAMRRLHDEWSHKVGNSGDLTRLINYLRAELTLILQINSRVLTSSTASVARILLDFLRDISWQLLEPNSMDRSWTFEKLAAAYGNLNASQPEGILEFLRFTVQLKRDAMTDISAVHWQGGFLRTQPELVYPFRVLEIPLPTFNLQRSPDPSVFHMQVPRIAPRVYAAVYDALYYTAANLALINMTWNPIGFLDNTAECLWNQYASLPSKDGQTAMSGDLNKTKSRPLNDLFEALGLASALDVYISYTADTHKAYRFKGSELYDSTQAFFIEYARNLCENSDPLYSRQKRSSLMTNFNGEAWLSVNGPLRNTPEFAKAFRCPVGSLMNPADRCPLIRKHY